MRKTLRKKLVCMLMMAALLLSAAITYAQPASADNLNADEVNRFNVILVIDGSGSLVSGSSATDKSGLRYDAINLFLVIYALSDFLIMILSWLVKQSLRAFLFQEVQL